MRSLIICLFIILLPTVSICASSPNELPAHNDSPIHIKSDQLLTETKNNIAIFSGRVAARQDDLSIFSDKMVVHYNENGGNVEQVECFGNVRIVQKQRSAMSGAARYNNKEGKIVLTINPKVFQGEDMISGSEITYYIADQRSIVTGAPGTRVEAVIHPKGKQNVRDQH